MIFDLYVNMLNKLNKQFSQNLTLLRKKKFFALFYNLLLLIFHFPPFIKVEKILKIVLLDKVVYMEKGCYFEIFNPKFKLINKILKLKSIHWSRWRQHERIFKIK